MGHRDRMRVNARVSSKLPASKAASGTAKGPAKGPGKSATARKAPSRRAPQQARSRAMVDAILDAATAVLRAHGYDDTTTNRVAEVAGVSVGSLYQYFPNKQSLVTALIARHDTETWGVFTTHAAAALGRPFAEAVPAVIDALFAAHLVDPDLHRVLHQEVPRAGAAALLHATSERSRAVVTEMLRFRAAELGHKVDIPTAALVIVETVEGLIHAALELPRARAEAVRAETSRLVLRYLGV